MVFKTGDKVEIDPDSEQVRHWKAACNLALLGHVGTVIGVRGREYLEIQWPHIIAGWDRDTLTVGCDAVRHKNTSPASSLFS